jgi:hypothetical protein
MALITEGNAFMTSTKHGKVSARRRKAAIDVLAEVVDNPNAPTHARVAASRALINAADREEKEKAAEAAEPEANLILPDNGRGPRPDNWYPNREAVEKALAEGKRGTFIVGSPEADAARERFLARQQRRLEQAGAQLALPAPDTICSLDAPSGRLQPLFCDGGALAYPRREMAADEALWRAGP